MTAKGNKIKDKIIFKEEGIQFLKSFFLIKIDSFY